MVSFTAQEEYKGQVGQALDFLNGNFSPILKDLERKMQEASENMEFEEAIKYRAGTVFFHLPGKQNPGIFFPHCHFYIRISLIILKHRIVPGAVFFNQIIFQHQRL